MKYNILLVGVACLALAACSKSISQRYAEKCEDMNRLHKARTSDFCEAASYLSDENKALLLKGTAALEEGEALEAELDRRAAKQK